MPSSVKGQYLKYLDSQEGYDAYNKFKVILYGDKDSLVQKIYDSVFKPMLLNSKEEVFTICDIGGGDGRRIAALLKKAHEDFPDLHFNLDFVEPSAAAYKMAESNFESIQNFVTIHLQNTLFEKSVLCEESFDLVLLIHSIFTFSNEENILKIARLKKSAGLVLIVGNHPESLMRFLNAEFYKKYSEKRYEIPDLLKDLRKLDIEFKTEEKVTDFFISPGEWDRSAEILFTWSSMGEYKNYTAEEKQAYIAFLRNLSDKNSLGYRYKEIEVFIFL